MALHLPVIDTLWWAAGAWLLVGCAVALLLASRGLPETTAIAAVLAWPFLLPLLQPAPPEVATRGPLGGRVDRVVDGVLQALRDADASTPAAEDDLAAMRQALHDADARIGRADQLLADTEDLSEGVDAEQRALRQARDGARDDLEGVLAGLVQLRLQVGRLALAGDTSPVVRQLAELRARVGALGELADLGVRPSPPATSPGGTLTPTRTVR